MKLVRIGVLALSMCAACGGGAGSGTPAGGAKDVPSEAGAIPADTESPAADVAEHELPGDVGVPVPVCEPACVAPLQCIDGVCGEPAVCNAGQWYCHGVTTKKQCNGTGTGFLAIEDCPGDQYCSSGQCGLKCSLDPKWGAYVGCTFWAADLPTWDDPTLPNAKKLPMSVVVSNPSEMPAKVVFTPPPGVQFDVTSLEVPGLGTQVFHLPPMLMEGSNVWDFGVRIASDRPVLVHQFNPWDNTYSNDASLLLPEPLLGFEHVVLSWPTDTRCLIELPIPGFENFGGGCSHGWIAVLAVQDDTEVFVRATARVAGTEVPPGIDPSTYSAPVVTIPKGGVATFILHKGQVLSLDAMPESAFELADLTGSLVLTDKPAAVFSGHDAAAISAPKPPGWTPDPDNPDSSCCLDHLEEQILPTSLLGVTYVAGKSKSRGGEKDLWRVVAAVDNVTLTTTPPIDGIHGKTLKMQGDWVEAYTDDSFVVDATGPVLIGQYLVGQADTSNATGDPSLMMAIPIERFRSTYAIMVPPTYDKNYVTVVRKPGVEIKVDGTLVDAGSFQPIVSGAWEIGWPNVSKGFHTITGSGPFGLTAYGYDSAASYGYPGGLTIPGEANP